MLNNIVNKIKSRDEFIVSAEELLAIVKENARLKSRLADTEKLEKEHSKLLDTNDKLISERNSYISKCNNLQVKITKQEEVIDDLKLKNEKLSSAMNRTSNKLNACETALEIYKDRQDSIPEKISLKGLYG